MAPNTLAAIRLAMPGAPALRDLAKKLGCSHEQLRQFELGNLMLAEAPLEQLSKLSRLSVIEIRRRFWFHALELMEERRREAESELKMLGIAQPRRRAGRRAD